MLLKTVKLFELENVQASQVQFSCTLGEKCKEETALIISPELWQELGQPSFLTVTILPGDQLNVTPLNMCSSKGASK